MPDTSQHAESVARLRAAIQDAIDTIERERLFEGSLDEEERILGVLRGALIADK